MVQNYFVLWRPEHLMVLTTPSIRSFSKILLHHMVKVRKPEFCDFAFQWCVPALPCLPLFLSMGYRAAFTNTTAEKSRVVPPVCFFYGSTFTTVPHYRKHNGINQSAFCHHANFLVSPYFVHACHCTSAQCYSLLYFKATVIVLIDGRSKESEFFYALCIYFKLLTWLLYPQLLPWSLSFWISSRGQAWHIHLWSVLSDTAFHLPFLRK